MKRVAIVAAAITLAVAAVAISGDPRPLLIAQAPPAPATPAAPAAQPAARRPSRTIRASTKAKQASPRRRSPAARSGTRQPRGNARFHTYVFQQRSGILVDWFRVLRTDQRDDRFAAYGLINDPGCCTPGADGCPAKSPDETYGFDWCPGDQELLKFVGKTGLSRPGV